MKFRLQPGIRSSAQGNCGAKSLVPVMSSILPCSSILHCPPCLPLVMLSIEGLAVGVRAWGGVWGRGLGEGKGEEVRGRGQGTFRLPCHILHYHMVLRPKGTSHLAINESQSLHFGLYVRNGFVGLAKSSH